MYHGKVYILRMTLKALSRTGFRKTQAQEIVILDQVAGQRG